MKLVLAILWYKCSSKLYTKASMAENCNLHAIKQLCFVLEDVFPSQKLLLLLKSYNCLLIKLKRKKRFAS